MDCSVHKLIADVVILADRRVLLVRYRDTTRYDGQEGWFLPDDFLEPLEHPTRAATRIAADQVGVDVPDLRLSHIESFGNGAWHLTFHHVATLVRAIEVTPGENVRDAEWFPLARLPEPDEVAHHGWALETLDQISLDE